MHSYEGPPGALEEIMTGRPRREEFAVNGDQVASATKTIFRALLVRRLALKTRAGRTLIWVPLIVGVVGAILLPLWALVVLLAALVVRLRIVVERVEKAPEALPAPCLEEERSEK
jgi:hypothetical protein